MIFIHYREYEIEHREIRLGHVGDDTPWQLTQPVSPYAGWRRRHHGRQGSFIRLLGKPVIRFQLF